MPLASGPRVVPDGFLLLGVDGDDWLLLGQQFLRPVVDVRKLHVALGVLRAFFDAGSALETEALRVQEFADLLSAHLHPRGRQFSSELAQALQRPPQRRLRVAAHRCRDELLQRRDEARVFRLHSRSSRPGPSVPDHCVARRCAHFLATGPHGADGQSRRSRHQPDAAAPQCVRFSTGPQPTRPLGQRAFDRGVLPLHDINGVHRGRRSRLGSAREPR